MSKDDKYIMDDKYILLARIGRGSYGKVYLVEKINDKSGKYALKMLREDKVSIIDKESFFHEIEIFKILSKEKNKYVPFLYDNGIGNVRKGEEIIYAKRPYFVIDYAVKGDLFFYLDKTSNGFKERHTKLIFKKILEGIQFCHKAHICHLDIKIQNILLNENFDPMITDFGFSEEIKGKEIELTDGRGTKPYACPEMWKKENEIRKIGFGADIFSLGVLLFKLFTNKYAFKSSKNSNNSDYRHIRNNNTKIFKDIIDTIIDKDFPDELKDLYIKMISLNPAKRPTIEQIMDHPWMKEIIDLCKDENKEKYEELEREVINEFRRLEEK